MLGTFELDDRQRRLWLFLAKEAEDGVGRLAADGQVLFEIPERLGFRGAAITEGFAEHVAEEIALKLGFFEFFEPSFHFEVGPFHQNRMSGIDFRVALVVEVGAFGSLFEPAGENQPIRFGLS